MSVQVHRLEGCRPLPLSRYLKALGVLRLVATQADESVRGCFVHDTFMLASSLSLQELVEFFLRRYSPTPLITPWNGGSGFYPKDNKEGFDPVRKSRAERFKAYREAIELGADLVGGATEAPKEEPKFALQRRLKRLATPELSDWMVAVMAFDAAGEPRYPALLGTGGNDGRLDFANNFMRRLTDLFDMSSPDGEPLASSERLLKGALLDVPLRELETFSVGQFNPGGVGGANSGWGFEGTPALNPWDFVLMLEGSVVLQSSIVRQLGSSGSVQAGAPFAFRSSSVGYASASEEDEGARGEQWMPIWSKPASFHEVRALFAEGRAQVGRGAAERPLDFARSLARLGVSRGVTAFQRFGYIERNGQANLAVPLARWQVRVRPHQDLVDNVVGWVEQLRRAVSGDNAPVSLRRASRQCEAALVDCIEFGNDALRWQQVLRALSRAERGLLSSSRFTKDKNLGPLRPLSPGWIDVTRDDSPEWRIAVGVASLHGAVRTEDGVRRDVTDPIRKAALPLDGERFATNEGGLGFSPAQVMQGVDFVSDLGSFVIRRALYPSASAAGTLGLKSQAGFNVPLGDVQALLDGRLDDRRILDLFWAFMAIKWSEVAWKPPVERRATNRELDGGFVPLAVFRAAILLQPPTDANAEHPSLEVQTLRCLEAGEVERATRGALRRLRATGVLPKLKSVSARPELGARLLAALAIPLDGDGSFPFSSRTDLGRLKDLVCKADIAEEQQGETR